MDPADASPSPRGVLGVVGTFVLDRIVGLPGRSEPVEDLGGLAYALAAVAASLPEGWTLRPIARVGEDASAEVRRWLEELARDVGASSPAAEPRGPAGEGGLDKLDLGALLEVAEPNNRVELRYYDAHDRTEHLTGGVGAWRPEELAARASDCDALLVNFISGHELDLPGAEALRRRFPGPMYTDLHSLFLDTAPDGTRRPRSLPQWRRWVACFDAVQLNEAEMDRMRGELDADEAARAVLDRGVDLVACTRGSQGAVCWAHTGAWRAGGRDGPGAGVVPGAGMPRDGGVERREIPAEVVEDADPTGCGDVWGGVLWSRLLAGESLPTALETACRLAGAAASSRGATGLAGRLQSVLGRHEDQDHTKPDGGGEL